MGLRIRRIVTGHDAHGKARVMSDGVMTNILVKRAGYESSVVWATETVPCDNDGEPDGKTDAGQTLPNGAVFRVVHYEPGVAPRMHRTDSLDFAIVISGAIDMELDDDEVVHLAAGDVVVQRGTIHNWINRGTETCVIAFVLLGAKPVTAGNHPLTAVG
jgi:quercetin dioxygenase-like cupin family protein